MNGFLKRLADVARRPDIILAVLLMVAVFMMILPLPTLIVDALIAVNLTLSLVLLTMSIYVRNPLEFSVFPALLLITTLYRLALTVSTSRLILLQHDAGEIVYAFGNFVVGGNLAVGIIVFAIITVVQFIVITKGSERVAEVGARFSLDGMPGKQMSIDGDMRAGTIDAAEARRQRGDVQKESQLYGAMDGAMKFVKGDAIAGIIVILVNIVGGIIVGIMQHGMSAGEAVSTYAVLSIGDGLIAQIPALIISIAAGIIVTRVPSDDRSNLAKDLLAQLGRYPHALMVAAGVLAIFALVPGFPAFVFGPLALALGYVGWRLLRKPISRAGAAAPGASGATVQAADGSGAMVPGAEPLTVRMARGVADEVALGAAIDTMRWHKFKQLGLALSPVVIETDATLARDTVCIDLYGEPLLTLTIPTDEVLADVRSPGSQRAGRREPLPFGGIALTWFSEAEAVTLEAAGTTLYRDEARLAYCVSLVVERFADSFVGVQETRHLMDAMEGRYGELVKELQRQLPVAKVAEVLQRLVAEGVSVRDLRMVFESLVDWSQKEKDTVMLVEYVRIALRRQIVGRQLNEHKQLPCWVIGSGIEALVRESVRQTAAGSYSTLAQEQVDQIAALIDAAIASHDGARGVLLTAVDVRRFLRKFIERERFLMPVLSFQELGDEVQVRSLGTIELIEESDHALA